MKGLLGRKRGGSSNAMLTDGLVKGANSTPSQRRDSTSLATFLKSSRHSSLLLINYSDVGRQLPRHTRLGCQTVESRWLIHKCEANAIGRETRFRSRSRSRATSLAQLSIECSTALLHWRSLSPMQSESGISSWPKPCVMAWLNFWDMSLRLFMKVGGRFSPDRSIGSTPS